MAESKRKFYRNTFLIEVLSEEPIALCPSLETIHHEMNDGGWVGEVTHLQQNRPVRAKRAAALLEDCSDPGFFRLTPDGEDTDELKGKEEKADG